MNFPYVLSDEILLRSKYEKKIGQQFYVLSDCPSLYTYAYKSVFTYIYMSYEHVYPSYCETDWSLLI